MTVVELSPNGHGSTLTDTEKRARARADWHADQHNVTGLVLGARYGMSPEWGRKQIRAARRERDGGSPGRAAGGTGGTGPTAHPVAQTVAPAARKPTRTAQTAVRPRRDWWQVSGVGVVLAVGLAVSYSHIVHLALLAGGGWWAWVMPLPLDGMALVSLRHLARERRYPVAWVGVAVGAVGSLAANVLAIDPTLADMRYVRWGFAALPPIAVVLCGHLIDRGNRGDR